MPPEVTASLHLIHPNRRELAKNNHDSR